MNLQINKYRLNALTKIDKIILILLFVFLSLPLSLAYAEENIAFIKKDDKRYKELSNKFKNCDEFLDVTWFKTDDPYMGYIREKRYISQEDPHNDDVFYNGEIFTSSLFVIDNYYLKMYNICSNIGKFYAENYDYEDQDYMDTDCSRFDLNISAYYDIRLPFDARDIIKYNTDIIGLKRFFDNSVVSYIGNSMSVYISKYSDFKEFGIDDSPVKMSITFENDYKASRYSTFTYSKNTKTVCLAFPDYKYSMVLEAKEKLTEIDKESCQLVSEVLLDINLDGKKDKLTNFNNKFELKSYSVGDQWYKPKYGQSRSFLMENYLYYTCQKSYSMDGNRVFIYKSYPPHNEKYGCSTISSGTLLTDGKYYYDTLPTCNLYELTKGD